VKFLTPVLLKTLNFKNFKLNENQEWWYMPVISTLGRKRQEDHKFKASLGYVVEPCLKKPNQTKPSQIFFSIFLLLFICAYKAWFISPPCPHPLPYHPLPPSLSPPQYPAETILPLFLILL
jgi:hypothetical protein